MFEDLWPFEFADLDFNDVHLTWHYEFRRNTAGQVTQIIATYNVLALGADLHHGLGLHLPLPVSAVSRVIRRVGSESLELQPTWQDAEFTVYLADDLRTLFADGSGIVNSVQGAAARTAAPMTVTLDLAEPTSLGTGGAPWDIFIFRSNDPEHEIHTPSYGGTARMRGSMFGTGIDGSTAARRFVDVDGLPYALSFPVTVQHPQEATPISALYPLITSFAASGGDVDTDFYIRSTQPAFAWSAAGAPTPQRLTTAADQSCLPNNACLAIRQSNPSAPSGIYTIDPDGSGAGASISVYCNMTVDGGGWTLVMRVQSAYHSTTAAVSSASLPNRNVHAKLADTTIRSLATAGQREMMLTNGSTVYIFRYTAAEWNNYASNGWTNTRYDAKNSSGAWSTDICSGHYNNRGFSTYSDAHGNSCPVVFAGSRGYFTQWHTYNYAGGVGGNYDIYVR